MRAAVVHFEHWMLDSMAYRAQAALGLIDACMDAGADHRHPISEEALLELRAGALALLAASGTGPEHLVHAQEALHIFEVLGNDDRVADMLHRIAGWYHRNADDSMALEHERRALAAYEAMGHEQAMADVLNSMGVQYRMIGELARAMTCHLDAMQVIERSGDMARIGWNWILIGSVFRAKGDTRSALRHFYKARAAFSLSGRLSGLAGACNDLGSAYQASGDLDSAMHWHRIAADLRRRMGEFNGLGDSHHYMGVIRALCDDPRAAMDHLALAYYAYGRVPNPLGQCDVLKTIAGMESERGEYRSSLEHLKRALPLLDAGGHTVARSDLYLRMASVHEQAGDDALALAAYERASAISGSDGYHAGIMRAHSALWRLHEERGEYMAAYRSHRSYLAAKDSVRRGRSAALVTQLAMRHGMEEQELAERSRDGIARRRREAELMDRRWRNKVYIAGGAVFGILAIGLVVGIREHDRSRVRSERQRVRLERAKARAQHGEQFKERFVANMSHEIRTPMNAIMGMTAILRRNEHLPAQRSHLDAIARSASTLLRILNDILDLSKLEAGRVILENGPVDMRELLADVIDELLPQADERGLYLRGEIRDEVPERVSGDALRIRQVLWNLVDNAIRFTVHGGVQVNMYVVPDSWLAIDVIDTGIGIPLEGRQRIFEQFDKLSGDGLRSQGGTGLGLAIGKRLAELHGGAIQVTSEEGRGSTFTLHIPLQVKEQVPRRSRSSDEAPLLLGLRILLAEDNVFNAIVAQDELREVVPGVLVDVALNGAEAVDLAACGHYDIILMDVQMPVMDGYEATRRIRSFGDARSKVPIVAMTATAMESDLEACRAAGMSGHVPKPFTRQELVQALKVALVDNISRS